MKDRSAADWEELARREPYFAVLTHEGFLGVEGNTAATRAFFDTGEADIVSLLAGAASNIGREVPLGSVLDFGCGVGRLTLPLARRAGRVIACDVAPTMLLHARKNAEEAGIGNVDYIETRELASIPSGSIDFVCSLLVMQHIPPSTGYGLVREFLRLLAPEGVCAMHVTFERPGGALRRFARSVRARSPMVHRLAGTLRGDPTDLPYMQMNDYDERRIVTLIEEGDARIAGRFPTRDGDTRGAVLIIEKPSALRQP